MSTREINGLEQLLENSACAMFLIFSLPLHILHQLPIGQGLTWTRAFSKALKYMPIYMMPTHQSHTS
jgi:hypothetical protein